MAGWRRAIELAMGEDDVAALEAICRSRSEVNGKSIVARKAKAKFDARAYLARADRGVTVSNYRRGQAVFTQGDPADSIFFIQEDRVKVTVVSRQGKEAVIAFLEAGDFIGEGCLTGPASQDFDRQGLVGFRNYPTG